MANFVKSFKSDETRKIMEILWKNKRPKLSFSKQLNFFNEDSLGCNKRKSYNLEAENAEEISILFWIL